MRSPISTEAFFLIFTAIHLIIIGIQILVYRRLRELWGGTAHKNMLLKLLLLLLNLPQVFASLSWIWGNSNFWVKGFAGLYFTTSLFYLLYIGVLRLFTRLSLRRRERFAVADVPQRTRRGDGVDLSRRKFLQRATASFGGFAAMTALGGTAYARGRPVLEKIIITHPDLPAGFDGLRIVQLSDFHAGPFMSRDDLLRIRETAEQLAPDIFALTGDFADSHPDQVPEFVAALQDLRGKVGTYAVLGNHDYFAGYRAVTKGLAEANLPLLNNEARFLESGGDRLAIIGIDDRWARRWYSGRGPNLAKATADIPAGTFKLCLSHQPQTWPECLKYDIDLTLSGHTHGGQIGLPGSQISLARLTTPFVAGQYRNGKNVLYVNRGLGTVGLPIRLGVPPEITLLILRRKV